MPSLISEQSVKIVKATAPVVAEHIVEITTTFYANLLGRHPELYNYFNETNQRMERQPQALSQVVGAGLEQVVAASALPPCLEKALFNNAPHSSSSSSSSSSSTTTPSPPKGKFPGQAKTLGDAVVAYAQNIEQLDQLSEAVVRITHKHCALGVQPEHYLLVHDTLLEAVGQVLGAAITEEVAIAWSEAVMTLAKLLIQMESDLYQEAAHTQWTGPRDFVITDETADIKSIRMVPADGKEVCPYRPGQYVSVYEKPAGKKYFAPRHYTLTSSFGRDAYYQITVKKQQDPCNTNNNDTTLDGIMSHHLHSLQVNDTIKLGPIFGPDTVRQGDKENRVAAFVSVGVGITPTMSLLPMALQERPQGVAVFHADLNSSTHAFGTTLRQMKTLCGDEGLGDEHSSKNRMIRVLSSSYSQPTEDDKSLVDYSEGRLTAQKIVEQLQTADIDFVNGVDYYICAGPTTTPLLVQELRALGVNQACLHLEFFGPFISV
jgi:nitric oxide dioxygenase